MYLIKIFTLRIIVIEVNELWLLDWAKEYLEVE